MELLYFLIVHLITIVTCKKYDFVINEQWMNPDGYWRPVITINGQSPGPLIEINQFEELIVNVFNNLSNKDITIHFHGIEQHGTPFMDGTPYVNQYPIRYNEYYQYKFNVGNQYGTYWYHTHTIGTYVDGLRGPIIVKRQNEILNYDEEHILMVNDWYHDTSDILLTKQKTLGNEATFINSILFNGKGQYEISDLPLEVINVKKNKYILLHFINSGAISELEISIDNHWMTIVEADGLYLKNPQIIQKFRISVGQRYSAIVYTNDTSSFIRATRFPLTTQSIEGKAILSYEGSKNIKDEKHIDKLKELNDKQLEPLDKINVPLNVDQLFVFNILNYDGDKIWTVNGTPFVETIVPSICQHKVSKVAYDLQYNSTIDILLKKNPIVNDTISHPFHLHGHKFWVLGFGENELYNPNKLNIINPPYRDVMNIPKNGWVKLRFKADNPGIWIFHCHIEWHMDVGMAIIFNEAFDKIPKPNFCD